MAITVVLTSVTISSDGKVYVQFSDGTQMEFATLANLTAFATKPDTDVALTQQMALAWILARSPNLKNIAQIQNKNFTFDLSNNNPIRVQ